MTPVRIPAAVAAGVIMTAFPAHGQHRLRADPIPEGPEPIVEALSPFRGQPDSSRVAKLLAEQAAAGFPSDDSDRVLVARLWRRAGETELALASLQDVQPRGDAADLATYEAGRVLLESGAEADGVRAYWSACASLDERVRSEIAWDLLPVTVPDEREEWPEVPAGERTCNWLRQFWVERGQQMAIAVDERITMHFRRLASARRDYYLARPRIEADMASDHGRPAGLAIDDRGLLYVRMGDPEYEQGCPEETFVPPDSTFINRLGVCWVYARPPHYRIFYLTTRDRHGWNLPDGDYRIQEGFGQQAEPGTLLFQKYVRNSDISRSTRAGLTGRGPASRLRRLVAFDGGVASPFGGFGRALGPLLPEDLDDVEYRRYEREIELAARRYTAAALEQIPDAPPLRATLDLMFEALRFLNPADAEWQIWMLGAVPVGQLEKGAADGSDPTIAVGGRFSVPGPDGPMIRDLTRRALSIRSLPADAGVSLRGVTPARPGSLPFTFVVEDLNAPGAGIWHQDTINVPSIGGLPQLSDIAVAQAEGGTWTRDGETFLQVSPAHITDPDGSIHTYFEVYGVRPGTRYEVEFRLAEAGAAERIWRLEPDDLGFRLRFTSEMEREIGRHHLKLDLSETEPGEYVLAVRIQDADTKAYSLPSVTDLLVAKR